MSSPAPVSVLSLHFPPEPTGNAPYAGALVAGLHERGHDVEAHVAHPHYPEWDIWPGYGQWTRKDDHGGAPVYRRRHYVPHPPRGMRRVLAELSFGARVVLARWQPRSVIISLSPSLFASALVAARAKLTRRRCVIWVQDLYSLGLRETRQGGRSAARLVEIIESATLRACDRVVVIHERFAEFASAELGVPRARIEVIRNWTHLARSAPVDRQAARESLGWPPQAAIAVHAGNMGVKQGLENVVEAARLADERQADVCFVLVGDGSQRAELEALGAGVERLRFIPPLGDADFRAALAAADVLVVNELPGVSAMAVPSKLTSYFDASRPIVAATTLGGITAEEIEGSGGGVVVEAGRPADLLDAVLRLTRDPAEADRLGRLGRAYRERVLDGDRTLDSWSELVGRVARAKRAQSR